MQAREKLEAARYFLEQMKAALQDRKVFAYNLDAFISISRSVTWVLQSQFRGNTKFEAWYEERRKEMREDPLMKFFLNMRNVSVKEHIPSTKVEASVSISGNAVLVDTVSIRVIRANGTEEGSQGTEVSRIEKPKEAVIPKPVVHRYFFLEKSDEDVITLCEKYLEKLHSLIEEAEEILK